MNLRKTDNRWQLVVSRRNCVLRINLILHGGALTLKNEIDFDDNHVLALSYDDEQGVYNDTERLRRMGLAIVKAVNEDLLFIEKNAARCVKVSQNLVKVVEAGCQGQDLLAAFKEYVRRHHEFSAFMFLPIGIENSMTKQVREGVRTLVPEERFQEIITKLTTPPKMLDSTQEQIGLMKIALGDKSRFDDLLAEHRRKYGFLDVYNQDEQPAGLDSYKTRLHALQETEVKKRLQELSQEYGKREKNFEATIQELGLSGHLLSMINILREYVYLRSYRLEMLNKSNLLVQPLLRKIGKKIGLTLGQVCALTAEEIVKGLEDGVVLPMEEIDQRLQGYIYLQQGEDYQIFTENLDGIKKQEFGTEPDYDKIKELKGTTACQGKAVGRVRVITAKEDIPLLQEGEILVTSMTTPDYVVAMERSAAIVTDEGGMLCHAAIVSREMGIPCVIGTEIATKALRTGDVVEVDADRGVVIISNRAGV